MRCLRFPIRLIGGVTLAASVGCGAVLVPKSDEHSDANLLPASLSARAETPRGEQGPETPAFAQPDRPRGEVTPTGSVEPVANDILTLDQLEELAQAHNPILQRDLARLESARGQALQAGLYPNPRFDTNNPEVFAGRNTLLNFGIQQEIVVKGKLRLDTAAAQQQVRQAELAFNQNRLALLTSVRRQYYSVLVAQRRVNTLTQLLEIVRSAQETGRKLEKAGETNKIDTLILTVDMQQVEANLRRSTTLLTGERKQLAAVVGVPEVEAAGITGNLTVPPPDFDEEVVRRYAVSSSTLIEYARAEVVRGRLLLQRAIVEPYPNINLGPAYQFGVVPGSDQFWLTVTFPIPAWNRNQGNIRSAVANIRDAEQSLKVLQNDQLQKVADALSRYYSARQLVESYEKSILPNVVQVQKMSQEGYSKGVFEFARYLQAQRSVVETNLSYVEALDSLWGAASDLAGILQLEKLPPIGPKPKP